VDCCHLNLPIIAGQGQPNKSAIDPGGVGQFELIGATVEESLKAR
jgi:hypothetical protein